MSKQLLVIFDIDETLIHYIAKKYTNLFFELPEDIQNKFNYIRDGDSIVLLRPGIKELFDYYANISDIKVGLWTYSEEEYSINIGNILVDYLGLPSDFFLFKYGYEQIQEISPDEDFPKNLEKIYEDFPEFNKFNTFLVDDAPSNIKHKYNRENCLLIQPFAPFGVEKVREYSEEKDYISQALNDDIFNYVQKISEIVFNDILGCDIEDIIEGKEAVFSKKRAKRMELNQYIRKYAKPPIPPITELVTIGDPKESKKFQMICGGKKKTKNKIPKKYTHGLSKKDKRKQLKYIKTAKKLYNNKKYIDRPKLKSYKNKTSLWTDKFKKKYGNITKIKDISKMTDIPIKALKEVLKKGRGAYYSSGSRPNQTAESWAKARMYSYIMGGPTRKYDREITKKYNVKFKINSNYQ